MGITGSVIVGKLAGIRKRFTINIKKVKTLKK